MNVVKVGVGLLDEDEVSTECLLMQKRKLFVLDEGVVSEEPSGIPIEYPEGLMGHLCAWM